MIRIGELAKKANISKDYYEQIALLKPALVVENRY